MSELIQHQERVWNGKEVEETGPFPASTSMEEYINYNFKFWDVCQFGGHDFVTLSGCDPQCAVCGTMLTEEYKRAWEERGRKDHLYGGPGWAPPAVNKTRTALMRCSRGAIEPSTVSRPGDNTERHNDHVRGIQEIESVDNRAAVAVASLMWPFFKFISHDHRWRAMNSVTDYGCGASRHWGNYVGRKEQECWLCGLVTGVEPK